MKLIQMIKNLFKSKNVKNVHTKGIRFKHNQDVSKQYGKRQFKKG